MSRDRRLCLVTGGVVLFAALSATGYLLFGPMDGVQLKILLITAALLLAVRLFPVGLHVGSGGYLWNWNEAALLVSLVTLPASMIPGMVGVLGLLAFVLRKQSPIKSTFNAATAAVSAGAATGVWLALGGHPGTPSSVGYLSLAAAGAVYALVANLLTVTIVAIASADRWSVSVRETSRVDILLALASIAMGLALGGLATWHPALLLIVPAVGYVANRMAINRIELSEQERAWARLDDTVQSLSTLDEDLIIARLVGGATGLLRATRARVDLSVTEPTASQDRRTEAVTVIGPGGPLGVLELDFEVPVTLSRREQRALNTLAAAAGAALHNARQHAAATHDALHDQLTGLPNRRALAKRVEELTTADERDYALLLIDLDRFKDVNDALGHSYGDQLLCEVGARLASVVRDDAAVCRLGGDEFAILLPGSAEAAAAERVAGRVLTVLGRPAVLGSMTVTIGGSVGIACAADNFGSTEELVRQADVAMYAAKKTGGGTVRRYDEQLDAAGKERLTLEPALRHALTVEGQIVVHVQPQVDMVTGEAIGAEALVRWRHPELGMLAPYRWLPLVNDCGLQSELTALVLGESLRQRTIWEQCGIDVPISVNLAVRDLLDPRTPVMVARLLAQHTTRPDRLVLEIPETLVGSEVDTMTDVLEQLHELGVQLSLDDFGAGGAPISMLTRVPVAEIKVDRSFVIDLVADETDPSSSATARARAAQAVVAAAVGLGRSLNQRVVAEGVETHEQVARLHALGCTTAQGFLYERPQPAEQALEALRARTLSDGTRDVIRLAGRRAR